MKRQRRMTLIAGMLFLAAFIGSCATPTKEPIKPIRNVDMSQPRAKLVTGSNKLLDKVLILNPRFRTVGQLTQAEVTVQNVTKNRYILEYKFDWADDQRFTVDSRSMWHRFILTPHQVQNFSSTGKTPEAKNIIFTVRLPHDAFIKQK